LSYKTPSEQRAQAEATVLATAGGDGTAKDGLPTITTTTAVGPAAAAAGTEMISPGAGISETPVEIQNQIPQLQAASKDKEEGEKSAEDKNPALSSLSDGDKAWLDPLTQVPFLPWPNEEMIAQSALARSQGWAGAVGDVIGDGQAGVANGPGGEEVSGGITEDAGVPAQASRQENYRRPSEAEQEKPKVFMGLDLYDPDED
jgi:hypothetical protein